MKKTLDALELLSAASRCRQLNALLQNLFEKGTDSVDADDELVGLAYDICGKITNYLVQLEQENS